MIAGQTYWMNIKDVRTNMTPAALTGGMILLFQEDMAEMLIGFVGTAIEFGVATKPGIAADDWNPPVTWEAEAAEFHG